MGGSTKTVVGALLPRCLVTAGFENLSLQQNNPQPTLDHVGHSQAGQVQQGLDIEVVGCLQST